MDNENDGACRVVPALTLDGIQQRLAVSNNSALVGGAFEES
jgi:hypothetical protein